MTRVKNGTQIQIGTELKIQVKNIPSDKTVEEWKINGKTVSSAPETFNHTIVKEDADSNGKTRITYTLKNKAALLRVDFDKKKVTVEALTTGEWKQLNSGSEIAENTQLRLTAIGLPADSTVESWMVGKTNLPANGRELTYTVRKADADNKTVTISYTERKRVNIKIHFDAAKVKVEVEQAGTWNALTSGSTVQEHTRLRLTALAIPSDKLVDEWKFGKTVLSDKGLTFEQTAELSHAENNAITVSYTLRDILNLTLTFDETKLKVEAEQTGTWNALTSGSTVQEHTRLRLTAIGLPADTPVQAWKVGNTIVPAEGSELIHTVRKVDADSSNRVALAYTVKSDKMIIAFDKTKVRVIDDNKQRTVRDGDELTVGMKLYIVTQNLPAGEIVDTWKIGKRNIPADSNDCKYTVTSEDAESSIIAISYTTKPAQKFTLNFDGSKMTVYERKEDEPWQTLSSGAQVEEGTQISIDAKDLPVGEIVDTWAIGKRTEEHDNGNRHWFTVGSDYAESGVINISYKTKPAQKFTLTFDAAKMRVRILQAGGGPEQTLANNAQVEEGTKISLEAKDLPAGQIVDTWKIGTRTITSNNEDKYWETVKSADAENGIITISYTTKPAKKFTLKFDAAKMTVRISQNDGQGKTLSNGAQVEEGTQISIDAKDLPVGEIVDEWTIGKQTEEANGNSTRFTVDSDYAKGNTIDISYMTKTAKKFTLKFEKAKMTVRISQDGGQGQTLSTDEQVEEGTRINIEAKDLPAGHIVDTWTIGKRTKERDNENGNSTRFTVGSDYAKGDTIDISYKTKTAKKFTLTFDAAKMTVTIPQAGGGQEQTLANNAQVEEGTQISIEAKDLPAGHIVDTWTIGKRTFEDKGNWGGNCWYFRVGSDYAKGNTIDISYTTKNG